MAWQREEAESDVSPNDMVLLVRFFFSCLAPELAQGSSGALCVDALPGFRESFSFMVFLYVFWGASGVLSAGVLIGLGCSRSETRTLIGDSAGTKSEHGFR